MKKAQRKSSETTKHRLLMAAGAIFAEHGYRESTIAEICEAAGVNIAAVNYHFHSKENLYAEAWRFFFREALKKHPPDGSVPEDAPMEERLRGRIASMIRRILDPELIAFRIIAKELANPTGLLNEIITKEIAPQREEMCRILRDLLGPGISEKQVYLCQVSIIGQCFQLMWIRQMNRKNNVIHEIVDMSEIDGVAEHVFRFSLGGIRAVREWNDGTFRKTSVEDARKR